MRALWVVALLFACSKSKPKPVKPLDLVRVDTAAVLAKETDKPPVLYLVEGENARVAAAATWADLDANKLTITKKPAPLRQIDRYVREDHALGRPPLDTIASLNELADDPVAIDLSELEDPSPRADLDDPPPPEEEDAPDDGEDESGGTGTTVALEEGKMGKKDSDRAEGQYRMKKNQEDPQLARQQAIEQARAAGILGSPSATGFAPLGGRPNEDGTPSRVAQVQGTVMADGKLDELRSMIVIAPAAPATKLIDAVKETDAAIAVSHGGKIRPLRVSFMIRDGFGSGAWLEARVSVNRITIEAVPDVPATVLDLKELAPALDKARASRGTGDDAPVDILVDTDVNAQRLIDVIVALDTAGVRHIGMGAMPSADELSRRGHRIPTTSIGQPSSQGDLDKALIRRVVRTAKPAIHDCYTKALATNPALEGTLQVQFFITPKGKVASSTASGVDPDVAKCVADVVKKLEFPEPFGGGGVQVNYPFTMRP